jgi:hypothetical protein
MNTLAEMYLGGEPTSVMVQDENLIIGLRNGEMLSVPLQVISQFGHDAPLPLEAQIVVLRKLPRIDHVHVSDSALTVFLVDGRSLSCPLVWFPRLLHGTNAERNNYELVGENDAIHWIDLDEDIELTRLFEGGKSTESEGSIQRWLASRQEKLAAH